MKENKDERFLGSASFGKEGDVGSNPTPRTSLEKPDKGN